MTICRECQMDREQDEEQGIDPNDYRPKSIATHKITGYDYDKQAPFRYFVCGDHWDDGHILECLEHNWTVSTHSRIRNR